MDQQRRGGLCGAPEAARQIRWGASLQALAGLATQTRNLQEPTCAAQQGGGANLVACFKH